MKNEKKAENKTVWESLRHVADIGTYRLLADTDECVVIRMENETGKGDMIVYQVFEGIYLMYNDFHMEYYQSEYQTIATAFAIDYCREGSLTMECDNGFCQVKKAGNVCVDSRVHHKGIVKFPTKHFHGITIGFERGIAEETLKSEVAGIQVNLEDIRNKFCGKDSSLFLITEDENLKRLFTDLYHVPERAKQNYFRVKILELLVYLSAIEIGNIESDKPYFYKEQIEKATAVRKLITEDLKVNYTADELSERFDISKTALKNCFKSLYGRPIYTYLTEYRMHRAAELLVGNPELSIGDIAFHVGYESAGKFSGAFKKVMGMTPKEYRNQSH